MVVEGDSRHADRLAVEARRGSLPEAIASHVWNSRRNRPDSSRRVARSRREGRMDESDPITRQPCALAAATSPLPRLSSGRPRPTSGGCAQTSLTAAPPPTSPRRRTHARLRLCTASPAARRPAPGCCRSLDTPARTRSGQPSGHGRLARRVSEPRAIRLIRWHCAPCLDPWTHPPRSLRLDPAGRALLRRGRGGLRLPGRHGPIAGRPGARRPGRRVG